ncbi:hypothetical protein RFI_39313 [Reticulomyxa filosa]|uniref:Uncharacterized protein n=1 Tax=Reticulomyxa filosa TaxID=46433 RepID=X6LAN5_RETFI|nr:hypothetical protein RFI_39313 [Reticulomyxa filosa]|eukprot:ETN98201.1 hypothetical protein RFI_39313 [Reticulomyxa filosa]
MEENNELKIMREMCLYILWDIISHPKLLNNTNSFYQILKRKCYRFNVNNIFHICHRMENGKNILKTLQVGNPKKSSFECNAHIKLYNDCSEIQTSYIKYSNIVLNHYWHFHINISNERDCLSNRYSVNDFTFLFFIQKFQFLNCPYLKNLKQGFENLKHQLQIIKQFMLSGRIYLLCIIQLIELGQFDFLCFDAIYQI